MTLNTLKICHFYDWLTINIVSSCSEDRIRKLNVPQVAPGPWFTHTWWSLSWFNSISFFFCPFFHSYLFRHVGQNLIFIIIRDGDAVGGLLVGFIKAGKRLASIGWLVVSGSDLPADKMNKDHQRQCRCFYPHCVFSFFSQNDGWRNKRTAQPACVRCNPSVPTLCVPVDCKHNVLCTVYYVSG